MLSHVRIAPLARNAVRSAEAARGKLSAFIGLTFHLTLLTLSTLLLAFAPAQHIARLQATPARSYSSVRRNNRAVLATAANLSNKVWTPARGYASEAGGKFARTKPHFK